MSIIKYEKKPFEMAVNNAKSGFLEFCGDPKIFVREAGFALQAIRGNQALQRIALNPIGQESIKNAITNVALIGISLNPALQLASLIPRKGQCCLDIQYRGLIKIATEENTNISIIEALVVYTWDDYFKYREGSNPSIDHEPNMLPDVKNVDEILESPVKIWDYVVCAYSRAIMRDGTVSVVTLPKWKLWKTFQTSQAKDDKYSPWQKWPEEQIRKTVIKYHTKTLQGAKTERLQKAVAILNEHEGLEKEAMQGYSNAEELNKRMGNNKNTPTDCVTMDTDSNDEKQHNETEAQPDKSASQGTASLEETFIKLLKAADTQKGLQSAWTMVMQKKDHLSQEVINRLTIIKDKCKADLQVKIKEKPPETLSAKEPEALDKKCRPCKQSESCMNKNSPARRNNCEGPFLI